MLQHINIRKSTGPDGLSCRFLKEVAVEIAEPLTKLYNTSLQSGCIPLEWKQCNITPVHKSGPQHDPSNYCPISVVPVIAKILEKIVANQLNRYFESNKLLSPFQGTYLQGKSTEQILLYAVDTIVSALDCGKIVCTAFLDLHKAFDSLDHTILPNRLSEMGVSGSELAWFTNYLSNHLQRVKLNGSASSCTTVKGRIPHGSALFVPYLC